MLGNPRQGYTEPAPKAPGLSRARRVARAVGGGSQLSDPYPGIRSIFANSHSLLQSGHTERVLSQRWMQSKWNTSACVGEGRGPRDTDVRATAGARDESEETHVRSSRTRSRGRSRCWATGSLGTRWTARSASYGRWRRCRRRYPSSTCEFPMGGGGREGF